MIRAIGGSLVFLFGAAVTLVGMIAVIDPSGTKLADDNDPFGEPPGRMASAVVAVAGAAISIAGLRLVFRRHDGR